jgi:hypothetical protein
MEVGLHGVEEGCVPIDWHVLVVFLVLVGMIFNLDLEILCRKYVFVLREFE